MLTRIFTVDTFIFTQFQYEACNTLSLSFSWHVSGSSSAGPGSPSVPYRTVLYRTVLYSSVCINLLHECSLSQVHAYSGPALPLLHLSVRLSVCRGWISVCLYLHLSVRLPFRACLHVCLSISVSVILPFFCALAVFPSNFLFCDFTIVSLILKTHHRYAYFRVLLRNVMNHSGVFFDSFNIIRLINDSASLQKHFWDLAFKKPVYYYSLMLLIFISDYYTRTHKQELSSQT